MIIIKQHPLNVFIFSHDLSVVGFIISGGVRQSHSWLNPPPLAGEIHWTDAFM